MPGDYESPNSSSEYDWSAPMLPAIFQPHSAVMESCPVQIDSHMYVAYSREPYTVHIYFFNSPSSP